MSQLARTTQGVAAPMTPRTPSSAPATPSVVEDSTPGRWKHPQFDEIARRQHATTFDERNVKMIVTNGSLLVGTFVAPAVISQIALLRSLS
jgi:nucleoporin POM34